MNLQRTEEVKIFYLKLPPIYVIKSAKISAMTPTFSIKNINRKRCSGECAHNYKCVLDSLVCKAGQLCNSLWRRH